MTKNKFQSFLLSLCLLSSALTVPVLAQDDTKSGAKKEAIKDELRASPKSAVNNAKAASKSDKDRLDNVFKAIDKAGYFSADFNSQTVNQEGQVVARQSGKFYWAGGKYRIEVTTIQGYRRPTTVKEVIIFDGAKTHSCNLTKKEMKSTEGFKKTNASVGPLLNLISNKNRESRGELQKVGASESLIVFLMHPKAVGKVTPNTEILLDKAETPIKTQWYLASPDDPKAFVIWREVNYTKVKKTKLAAEMFTLKSLRIGQK